MDLRGTIRRVRIRFGSDGLGRVRRRSFVETRTVPGERLAGLDARVPFYRVSETNGTARSVVGCRFRFYDPFARAKWVIKNRTDLGGIRAFAENRFVRRVDFGRKKNRPIPKDTDVYVRTKTRGIIKITRPEKRQRPRSITDETGVFPFRF